MAAENGVKLRRSAAAGAASMRPRRMAAENTVIVTVMLRGMTKFRGSFNEAAAHGRGKRTRRNPLRSHVFTAAPRGLLRS